MIEASRCQACNSELDADASAQDAEYCAPCLRERVETLEDALERIGRLCIRIPGAKIAGEIEKTVGTAGEKRWT